MTDDEKQQLDLLERYALLHAKGLLTNEEYEEQKRRILISINIGVPVETASPVERSNETSQVDSNEYLFATRTLSLSKSHSNSANRFTLACLIIILLIGVAIIWWRTGSARLSVSNNESIHSVGTASPATVPPHSAEFREYSDLPSKSEIATATSAALRRFKRVDADVGMAGLAGETETCYDAAGSNTRSLIECIQLDYFSRAFDKISNHMIVRKDGLPTGAYSRTPADELEMLHPDFRDDVFFHRQWKYVSRITVVHAAVLGPELVDAAKQQFGFVAEVKYFTERMQLIEKQLGTEGDK